eukprot:CAMPEP_0206596306 /NCGR_PEP_ID=MMETSP0325_2-20121206/43481_1 /ASSEMBLY_ACC=CAM_ASM_000347 /TAXON_ID=2866 /ORGANISM="Crypthecodinium cohnii, Strain Seligo" /LENGTH=710 /DNA_ID=CAMNT_0054107113 /DNA_START=55 /DNA_END=2187 /DNA_ORIENTATION=-
MPPPPPPIKRPAASLKRPAAAAAAPAAAAASSSSSGRSSVTLEVNYEGRIYRIFDVTDKTVANIFERVAKTVDLNADQLEIQYKDKRKWIQYDDGSSKDPALKDIKTWTLKANRKDSGEPQPKKMKNSQAAPTPLERAKDWVKKKNCQAPKLPTSYNQELLHRKMACTIVQKYLQGVQAKALGKDGKFSLVGCSGMKGIGKTAMLVHSARCLVPEGATALYLTFNGGGAHKEEFLKSLQCQEGHKDYAAAFGHMLLAACGVDSCLARQLEFEDCLDVYRSLRGLSAEAFVVVFVDEIGDLEEMESTATLTALMRRMDKYPGQLAFVFAHIRQDILDKCATKSAREVTALHLPALQLDDWKKVVGINWQKAAKEHAQIQQLLLACSGHPRSLVDGLPAALVEVPNLLTNPDESSLVSAMDVIMNKCKFNEFDTKFMADIVPQWFDFVDKIDTGTLARDGVLLKVNGETAAQEVELLHPLILLRWARKMCEDHSIPHHLQQAYAADAMVGPDAEKKMENIMYHYEALLKKCVESKEFTLMAFYCSRHIGKKFLNMTVKAHLPRQLSLVHKVDNFQNIKEVLHYLKQGFIVVSQAHSEVGIEYLSPFVCVDTEDLIVAAVQCKFVQASCAWADMKSKMEKATKDLKEEKVRFFPVFYTSVDQNTIHSDTFSDGVYFTESDLFTFTKKLGILRLHVMKLGAKLQEKYPWLKQAV